FIMEWDSNSEFVQAMMGPLPSGLVALDFGIQFLTRAVDWEDEEPDQVLDHMMAILDCLGGNAFIGKNTSTVFGASADYCLRTNIVTTEEIVRAWFKSGDTIGLSKFPMKFRLVHKVTQVRSVNSLRGLIEKESWRGADSIHLKNR